MMFFFRSILQISIIFNTFWETNNFVNLGICKQEFMKIHLRIFLQIYLNKRKKAETNYFPSDQSKNYN